MVTVTGAAVAGRAVVGVVVAGGSVVGEAMMGDPVVTAVEAAVENVQVTWYYTPLTSVHKYII